MICCNCWSCCLDLRAKVRLDDESIYSILFLVNKDANRRKEDLSTQIEELKALLERPAVITAQPSCDNRHIVNNFTLNSSSNKVTVAHQMNRGARNASFSTPITEKLSSQMHSTPYGSKMPSFSENIHLDTGGKKKQFAMSQSFSERTPLRAPLPLLDKTQLLNADSREFLIMRLIDENKYEDALEKSVQLVDMRRTLLQDAQKRIHEGANASEEGHDIEQSEIHLNRATILLARCWKLLRRSQYSLTLLEDVLSRQKQAKKINLDGYMETLKLCVGIHEELKQPNVAISFLQQQLLALKERFNVLDLQSISNDMAESSSIVGIAHVMHLLAEFSAEYPDFLDLAITTYLDEIFIYERLRIPVDWRTLYRLGQLLAKRSEFRRAIVYFDSAIALILQGHGDQFNPLGDIYHSKALSLWQLEELPQAIHFLKKALPIKLHHWELEQAEQAHAESNSAVPSTSDNAITAAMINHALGEITEEMGHVYDAIPFFEKAMEYYTLGYGTREHMSVAETLHGLGDLLLQLEVKKEALACFEQAYQLYSLFRGKYHLANMDVLAGKALVLRMMGRGQDALYVLQFVYEVYAYELGEDDEHAKAVQMEMESLRETLSHSSDPTNDLGLVTGISSTPVKEPMTVSPSPAATMESAYRPSTMVFASTVAGALITGGSCSPSKEYEYCRSLASSTEDTMFLGHNNPEDGNGHTNNNRNNNNQKKKRMSMSSSSCSSPVKSPLFLAHLTSSSSTTTSSSLSKASSPRRALQTSGQQGETASAVVTVQPAVATS